MADWGQLIAVRPLDPRPAARERAYVIRAWIMSWSPHTHPPLLPSQAEPIVEAHLDRCDRVLVATVPGVAHVIAGFVARLEPGVLGYLYVSHDYRRHGIATRLMREAGLGPRGARWRYAFGTPRLRRLCHYNLRSPERTPWDGVPNGQGRAPRHERASR